MAYRDYREDDLALRFSRPGHAIPSVEIKLARTGTHGWSLRHPVKVLLNRRKLPIGPLELQHCVQALAGLGQGRRGRPPPVPPLRATFGTCRVGEGLTIVYGSDDPCFSSKLAVVALERAGYRNVWHFKDGLREWMDAGYPIEGTMAHSGP